MYTVQDLAMENSHWAKNPPRSRCGSVVLAGFAAVLLLPFPTLAKSPAIPRKTTVVERVDSLVLARLADPQGPASMSVMIVLAGDTLVHEAWGTADVASNLAATEASTYRIGSVNKQFTAALLLKLVDRGELSLDDTLGRHLTGLRPEWRTLTVEQVLNHTSELQREYRQHVCASRRTESEPRDSLFTFATRDTLVFAAGTRFAYSNSGYMILDRLVEKLYGKLYRDALRDEIARPLGLATLGWCTAPEMRATETKGYQRSEQGELQPAMEVNPDLALGAGGICASAADLARWNLALHGGRVLAPASAAAMTTPRGAAADEAYDFGIRSRSTPWGTTVISHNDATPGGFLAENASFPAKSLSITVLYNSGPSQGTSPLTPLLARIALGLPLSDEAAVPSTD
jgi:D-alanyl-D-alanine carboxypeptidase